MAAGSKARKKVPKNRKGQLKRIVNEEGMIDLALTDMKRFHMSVDWHAWWLEFYLALRPQGTPRYPGIRSFAQDKAKNELQALFIEFVIGPETPTVEVDKAWLFVKPMDWLEKREKGGWYSPTVVKGILESISTQASALQAMEQVGKKITIKSLVRFEQLAAQLDKEFAGHFFAEGLSFNDNMTRARLYVRLHEDIMGLQARAQDLYAKNHGINYAMDGFQQMMLGAKVSGEVGDPAQQRMKNVMGKIIDMTLTKSTTHDIPIPEEMEKQVMTLTTKSKLN